MIRRASVSTKNSSRICCEFQAIAAAICLSMAFLRVPPDPATVRLPPSQCVDLQGRCLNGQGRVTADNHDSLIGGEQQRM